MVTVHFIHGRTSRGGLHNCTPSSQPECSIQEKMIATKRKKERKKDRLELRLARARLAKSNSRRQPERLPVFAEDSGVICA